MLSMTGFASGEAPLGDGRVTLEIRALNHRFLDVRVRLPTELSDQAFFVEQLARSALARGRYDIGVRLEGPALPDPGRCDARLLCLRHHPESSSRCRSVRPR